MTSQQQKEIIAVFRKDCLIRYVLRDSKGRTCAMGGLNIHYTGNAFDEHKTLSIINREQRYNIVMINNSEPNLFKRRSKLINYIKSQPVSE